MDALVRPAVRGDAATIAAVHVASWRAAYAHVFPAAYLASLSVGEREDRWRNILADETTAVVVAEAAGQVVGVAAGGPSRDADVDPSRVGELQVIYLAPAWWGLGVGSRLHDAVIGLLTDRGLAEATLWVLDRNHRARRFYEFRGWTADGTRKDDERGGVSFTELRYRTPLHQ